MSKLSKIYYFLVSLLFFIVTDFYFTNLILKYGYKLTENPVLDFVFIKNDGAAFNILQDCRVFLIAFSAAAIVGIFVYLVKNIQKLRPIVIFWSSILCSGIFCNLIERICLGHVRDFIKLNFVDFPIFNISDIFITLSVFGIVIIIIKNNYFKR